MVTKELRAVIVSYEDNGRKQSMKKTFIPDLKVGEYVLVRTGTRHNATVCRVERVNVNVDYSSTEEVGWIASRVDLDEFDRLEKLEGDALFIIENAERRAVEEEMRAKIQAQCGPELAALQAKMLEGPDPKE